MVLISIFNKLKWQKDLDFKGDVNEFASKVKSVRKSDIITSIVSMSAGSTCLMRYLKT